MGGAAPAAAWGWAPQGHGAPLQPPQGTPRPDFCTWVGIAASEVGCPSREAEGPASCSWSGLARPSEGCGTQEGGAQRTAMRPSARCGWRRPRHAGRRGHGPPVRALPSHPAPSVPWNLPPLGTQRRMWRGAGSSSGELAGRPAPTRPHAAGDTDLVGGQVPPPGLSLGSEQLSSLHYNGSRRGGRCWGRARPPPPGVPRQTRDGACDAGFSGQGALCLPTCTRPGALGRSLAGASTEAQR